MKSQIELAKEKGIEVGSRVRYTELYPQYFGEIDGIVSFIHPEKGAFFKDENGYTFIFPVQSLEKVEAHSDIKIDAVMVVRKDNQEIITVSNNIHYVQSFYEDLTGVEIVPVYIVRKTDALIAELNKGEG